MEARPTGVANSANLLSSAALVAVAATAWLLVVRASSSMTMSMAMPGASPSLAEGASVTAQWGVMMTAMMLPSATPLILLYGKVSQRMAERDPSIPVVLFAAVYLLIWGASGIPVYGGYIAMATLGVRWHALGTAVPYAVAAVLIAAGVYQFSNAKRVCLRHCEAPLSFLMRRWRSGYAATLLIAAEHAAYCIGCCWALMTILVVAGAMSMTWVLGIAIAVFAEKVLPRGWRTARFIGATLIALGASVAVHPALARTIR